MNCTTCNDTGYVCDVCREPEDDCVCDDPELVVCDCCPDEDDEDELAGL